MLVCLAEREIESFLIWYTYSVQQSGLFLRPSVISSFRLIPFSVVVLTVC